MSMTNELGAVAAAEASHSAARSRLAELHAGHAAARQAVADADRAVAGVIARAARGEPTTGKELGAVRKAAENAKHDLDIAEAIVSAGQAAADQAECDLLHAIAGDLAEREAALMADATAAASAADAAVQAAQAALAKLVAIEDRCSDLRTRLHTAGGQLRAAQSANGVLLATPRPEHPRFREPAQVGLLGVQRLAVGVLRDGATVHDGIARTLGLAAPDPAEAARIDLALKMQALGAAELDRIAAAQKAGAMEREGIRGPAPIQQGVRLV